MPKLKRGTIFPTPEEAAAIDAAAKADPDTVYFETDEEMDAAFARAVPYKTYMAGRNKVPISIRLDQVVLDHFKKAGAGWQGRINDALRAIALAEGETAPGLHEPSGPAFKPKS